MGELLIGGVQVGYGYLNRPVENAQHFVDDPFKWHLLSMKSPSSDMPCRLYRTGDLVRWNSDGEIEFMGRIKGSFVKVRGFRVELFGVQAILQKIPGVMMAIVKVERDPLEVDSIVAYLKLKIGIFFKKKLIKDN
jgi:non-ribosomal peptide synthetase component F